MAVALLADDLLAEGDYYRGGLLYNVVRLREVVAGEASMAW